MLVERLKGVGLIFGNGFKNIPTVWNKAEGMTRNIFMTAATELLYCQGIVGTLIFSGFYLYSIFVSWKTNDELCMTILLIGIALILGGGALNVYTISAYIPFLFKGKQTEKIVYIGNTKGDTDG